MKISSPSDQMYIQNYTKEEIFKFKLNCMIKKMLAIVEFSMKCDKIYMLILALVGKLITFVSD